ncbi:TPM domain-containing protein [Thermoanaerobacterium sp. R66]|uniref:TPM domain-containing protein n=1 Tax=Thermoanaerobacterium sp. R66 TaxID=2742479 RepID=UPI00238092BD|nr:TPM domain-containing protein [Thermoanaerobacterium sp. R66]
MLKYAKTLFLLIFFPILIFGQIFAATIPPKPSQYDYVYDYAKLMSQNDIDTIRNIGKEIENLTGAQIIVVTVDDIGDYQISDYALNLFRNWGIGQKDKNNGVLLLVDKKRLLEGLSGKVFISVGYGLEGAIPDSVAGRILDDYVLPKWNDKDYSGGIVEGYKAIATLVAKEYNVDLKNVDQSQYTQQNDSSSKKAEGIISVIALIILLIIFSNIRGWWWRGPGGFGPGGFGGFGGFGTGGGGFGGGFGSGGGGSFGGGSTGGGGAGR